MRESIAKYQKICNIAKLLVEKFSSRNPFVIAEGLGLQVLFTPLSRLKGVYKVINGVGFIILNQNDCEEINKLVCAHELGHHVIHREFAENNMIRESVIYDLSRKYELEANVFAAQLLIDDKVIIEYIKEGFDIEKIAKLTETDPNLIAIKCSLLINQGYDFIPQEYDTVFLK